MEPGHAGRHPDATEEVAQQPRILAAVAARTRNIRLMTGGVVARLFADQVRPKL